MRLRLLVLFLYLSCLSFGQDSSQLDTSSEKFIAVSQDSMFADTALSALNHVEVKIKKQKKKVKNSKIKEKTIANKELNAEDISDSNKDFGLVIILVFAIALLMVLAIFRSTFAKGEKRSTDSFQNDEFISDSLRRMLMSRRDYYRNVYLKSEEWQRKRYLVLKRDNWRCVYCGGKATQVHHTRYAKRNIGKEPIEWLVSICSTCHDSKHL